MPKVFKLIGDGFIPRIARKVDVNLSVESVDLSDVN
jgi:hypothetical protein